MVIRRVLCFIIRAPAECISFVLITRFMVELIVILLELDLPCCGTWADFLGFRPVCQVLVVHPDENRELCSTKEVRPMPETFNDCKEFTVVDLIILLCQ